MSIFDEYTIKAPAHYLREYDANCQLELLPAPRLCNTGVQITEGLKTAKIDWLEFTVKGVLPDYAVPEYLALAFRDFVAADYGMQGYTDCYEFGFVKVLFSPAKPERGTKIILSSKALDEVGNDGILIINRVLRDGGTFARIDVALDDRTGDLSVQTFIDAEKEKKSVAHFVDFAPIEKFNRSSSERVAWGCNYGSRCSDRYIRIYDKSLETVYRGGDDPGPWLRVEMQANKRAAYRVACALLTHGLDVIPRIVTGALDYRDREACNVTRDSRCPWWAAFVGAVTPVKTGVLKVHATIEKKLEWICTIKKTLGQVVVGYGKEILADLVMTGIDKTTISQWRRLFPDRDIDSFYADVKAGLQPIPF